MARQLFLLPLSQAMVLSFAAEATRRRHPDVLGSGGQQHGLLLQAPPAPPKARDMALRGVTVAELLDLYERLPMSMPHFDPLVSTTHCVVRAVIIPQTIESLSMDLDVPADAEVHSVEADQDENSLSDICQERIMPPVRTSFCGLRLHGSFGELAPEPPAPTSVPEPRIRQVPSSWRSHWKEAGDVIVDVSDMRDGVHSPPHEACTKEAYACDGINNDSRHCQSKPRWPSRRGYTGTSYATKLNGGDTKVAMRRAFARGCVCGLSVPPNL